MNHLSATPRNKEQITERVLSHPKFQKMTRQKSVLGWSFSAVIFVVYVAYIWIIGTNPQLFAHKVLAHGVTTLGIYVGIFVIVFSFLITWIYVILANGKYERETQEIVHEVMGENK